MDFFLSYVGYIAAALSTAGFVPQAIHTIRTRSTKDLSMSTFLILCTSTILWFVYGMAIRNLPIIFANGITCSLLMVILSIKIKNEYFSKKGHGTDPMRNKRNI